MNYNPLFDEIDQELFSLILSDHNDDEIFVEELRSIKVEQSNRNLKSIHKE